MGKSKRKRKIKEEDFKKKKLRVGKRLPMPDNVTKTSFKAKRIHILQNQEDGDVDDQQTSFKRHNLKDLLSSCSHYNTQAREEALLNLKDFIEKHSNALKNNLNDIFQRILGKITDIEYTVRRGFLSLISSIFRNLSSAEITPFFPSVVAYLCSAMTHLNDGVRLDSMKFLDHCLQFYPQLLSRHSKNVIQNFLDVISSEEGSSKKPGVSKTSLKAKVTSQKAQLEVLARLNHLLHAMLLMNDYGSDGYGNGDQTNTRNGGDVGQKNGSGHAGRGGGGSTNSHDSTSGDNKDQYPLGRSGGNDEGDEIRGGNTSAGTSNRECSHWNGIGTSGVTVHLSNNFFTSSLVSNFSLKTSCGGSSCTSSANLLANEVQLRQFITSLSSVLFEYWVECCPAEFTMNLIPVNKTSISLQIMKEILEIFVTLVQSLENITSDRKVFLKFIKDTLFEQFNNHFVAVFPMSFTLQQTGLKRKKDSINQSTSDITLNLLICQLLCYVIPEEDGGNLPKWITNIFQYFTKIMVEKSKGSNQLATVNDIKTLTKLVKLLISTLPNGYNDLKVELLKNLYQFFAGTHAMSNTKRVLLNFLEDLLKNITNQPIPAKLRTTIDVWLCSLVKLFTNKNLGLPVVHSILVACKLGIVANFPNIGTVVMDALPGVFKPETFLRFEQRIQLLTIEILYHLKQTPSKQLYEILSCLCNSRSLSLSVFHYITQVVFQLANPEPSSQVSVPKTSNYLSFVLSVVIGQSQEELTKLQTHFKSLNWFSHPVSKANTLVTDTSCFLDEDDKNVESLKEAWEYHKSIISILSQYVALTEYSECIGVILVHPLIKLFDQYTTLPLTAVYHIFALIKTKRVGMSNAINNSNLLQAHLAKWCALLWHFVLSLNADSTNAEFFQSIVNDIKQLIKELLKVSSCTLQSCLELLRTFTSSSGDSCTVSCKVVTEMLKSDLFHGVEGFENNYQPYFRDIQKNLEKAFTAGMVESQILSDFNYQFSCYFSN